jgi:phosphate uptake regulator
MNKLQHALFRPSLDRFLNNLKKILHDKNRNDKLKNALNDINELTKYVLMKRYLYRWADNNQKLADKTNECASIIQRAFKGHKARNEKDRLLRIKKLLIIYLLKKENISNNKLYSAFTRWLNIVRNLQCNDNARIIQQFCR